MSRLIQTSIALAWLLAAGLSAQTDPQVPEKLTLLEAKRLALAGNPGMDALLARIQAAEAVVGQARSARKPQLTATAAATWLDQVSLSNGDDGSMAYYQTGLGVNWLLFDGFATRFRIKAAQAGNAVSLAEWRDGQRLLAEGVATTFLNCLLAQEASRVTERDAEFNRSLLDEAKKRLAAGAGARVDVLNFSVRVRTAENSLLGTRRDLRAAKQVLAALLGLEFGELPQATVLVSLADSAGEALPEAQDAIEAALAKRPDLSSLDHSIAQLQAVAKSQQGAYMPTLVAQAEYDLARAENARFNASRDADSYVGLALSWNLFDGGRRRYSLAETKALLRAAAAGRNQLRNEIASEVRRALDNLSTTGRQYTNQREITNMSREIRGIVHKEYLSGLSPLTRLNEVQTDLVRAEGALARTRILQAQAAEVLASAVGENLP
jgi:outer membrane protein TolC